jgi:ABC-type phosphate transport system substrate-binding protein
MLSDLLLVATILLSAAPAQQARSHAAFIVIAHPSTTASTLTRAELSAIFMRRTRSWNNGTEVRPVEPSSTRARELFSRTIHGKSLAYVTRYWHRVIFAGRGVPPSELSTDAAVIEYVKSHRGAIGYVETAPGDGVKVLAVTP